MQRSLILLENTFMNILSVFIDHHISPQNWPYEISTCSCQVFFLKFIHSDSFLRLSINFNAFPLCLCAHYFLATDWTPDPWDGVKFQFVQPCWQRVNYFSSWSCLSSVSHSYQSKTCKFFWWIHNFYVWIHSFLGQICSFLGQICSVLLLDYFAI